MKNAPARTVDFTSRFNTQRKKAPLEIKIAFREALELFLEDPHHEFLRNHSLTGKYAGIRSIDITDDWRALYREGNGRVIFIELGTHAQLYG